MQDEKAATFKDDNGRQWNVKLNYQTVERVRETHNINFGAVLANQGELYLTLRADPIALIDALAAILEPGFESVGLTADGFKASLSDGDTIDSAWLALNAAILNFYPRRQREAITTLAAKMDELAQQGLEMMRGTSTEEVVKAIQSTRNGVPKQSDDLQTSGSRDSK